MITRCKNFIQKGLTVLFVAMSFVFFWWRAVEGHLNIVTVSKLIVGLAIILPVFFITDDMRILLKKIFSGKHKYLKLYLYIILISFSYSALLTARYYPTTFPFSALCMFFAILIWQPVCIIILGYVLMGKVKKTELAKVFLLVLIVLVCEKIYSFTDNFFSNYSIYNFTLLQIHIPRTSEYFNLLEFWSMQLPIMFILISDMSSDCFGFNRKWNKNMVVLTLFFLSFLMFRFEISRSVLNLNIGSKQYIIWNMITFCYPVIIASFSEEFIFRGVIQNYISRKLSGVKAGNIIAIIIASIIFALAHYPFSEESVSFLSVFIGGFICGWLYYKTQNLWPPILYHGLHNLIGSSVIQ